MNWILIAQGGITHAFVINFMNAADCDYYVKDDPVHQEFVWSLGGLVERAQVIDFTNSIFWEYVSFAQLVDPFKAVFLSGRCSIGRGFKSDRPWTLTGSLSQES